MLPSECIACLSVVTRPDGFRRVAGSEEAFRLVGFSPVQYLDERRSDVRDFADELHRLALHLLDLADRDSTSMERV